MPGIVPADGYVARGIFIARIANFTGRMALRTPMPPSLRERKANRKTGDGRIGSKDPIAEAEVGSNNKVSNQV